jgi:hypothetical protein
MLSASQFRMRGIFVQFTNWGSGVQCRIARDRAVILRLAFRVWRSALGVWRTENAARKPGRLRGSEMAVGPDGVRSER